ISGGTSTCYGGCADAWPPVLVTDESPSGVSGLGSITRTGNTVQVTYEGRPLYFYAGDQQPGDRSGDNVAGWHSIEYGNIGQVNKLYNDSTDLEPVTAFTRDDGVIVTRIADRGRDRHAKDSGVQDHYDHYLAHYWQYRTMRIQLEDYVPLGQSRIKVTWITEAALGAKEFRVWYAGQNTSGQFWFNPQPEEIKVNQNETGVVSHGSGFWYDDFSEDVTKRGQGGQHKYTLEINTRWQLGGQIQEPLQMGMNMEFEASMFLLNPPAGSRLNYYGTSFVYKIGQPGVNPFEWQLGTKDGTPIPTKGLSGGGTTLGYNYTNEPAGRFMQMATNMAPGNAKSFVLGRRVHHTSFLNGVHGERGDNPPWTEQSGKSGTHYINESCAGCHVRNGRALVADVGGSLDKWVFKVGDANGNPMSSIGSVLQPTKIGGGSSEGTVTLGAWSIMDENDFDGDFVGLRKPNYQFSNVSPPKFSARIAPSLVGMGLLEAVDESTIISWEDENDSNNDDISGRASIVSDPASGVMRLGRFGYKAATFSVEHQVASAFNTDMGVMTSMIPNPDCGSQQTNCGNTGSEIADEHVANLVKYVSLLGVGARRNYNNTTGEALFDQIGCADCHRPSMVTSNHHPLSELRGQTIYPYTDLLLHDMGPGLADSLGEGTASGSEWRTAPLWGLGLTKNVMLGDLKGNDLVSIADAQDRTGNLNRIGYLHDGRAKTIDEAIRWHGGEAENSRRLYSGEQVGNQNGLTDSQRNSIVQFLESL
ncbi:thiol oxidoreductase, partial [Porticoccaceae bacterium]|nr:thiol oxidoreductase [Porticoccaceae bacterium]